MLSEFSVVLLYWTNLSNIVFRSLNCGATPDPVPIPNRFFCSVPIPDSPDLVTTTTVLVKNKRVALFFKQLELV
jgi:hypothetical protein